MGISLPCSLYFEQHQDLCDINILMKLKSHPFAACKRLEDSFGFMAWGPLASCPVSSQQTYAHTKQQTMASRLPWLATPNKFRLGSLIWITLQ